MCESYFKQKPSIDLPDDVIEEILSKSPIKSVVRFKSVSKSWQSIISDSRFCRTHHMQRFKLRENQNKFLSWSRNHQHKLYDARYSVYLIGFEDGKFQRESVLDLPYESRNFMSPLCYCDGLFLLSNELNNHYTLWNPYIRKHTTFRVPRPSPCLHHLYFDSITDDYKIVFGYENCYTVYSYKKGNCGEMKEFPHNIISPKFQAFLDGCFYSVEDDGEIVCFDVRDENLHKFRHPNDLKFSGLYVVSGSLCFYIFSGDDIRRASQFWVMEKNGSFEKWCFSWRKLFTMEIEKPYPLFSLPLWLFNEDNVVLRVGQEHMIYNPRQNSFRPVEINYSNHRYTFHPYSENLYMPSSN